MAQLGYRSNQGLFRHFRRWVAAIKTISAHHPVHERYFRASTAPIVRIGGSAGMYFRPACKRPVADCG
jgi:hypothetical protein